MKLNVQKRLAASLLKCSKKKIVFDTERLDEIKESITKADIRGLISSGAISIRHSNESSRGRARIIQKQKSKGRQKGKGSRKGSRFARMGRKRIWINNVRVQKSLLKTLRDKEIIAKPTYRELYMKTKGGFFRSIRHLKLYIDEHNLAVKKK